MEIGWFDLCINSAKLFLWQFRQSKTYGRLSSIAFEKHTIITPLEPWEGGKSLEYLESWKTFILHPSTRQEALNYWYIGIYIGLEDYFFQ